MRIAIDLQSCQNADTSLARETLALVQKMLGSDHDHTVWIAFSNQFPARIELLRGAFDGLVPSERIHVYDTPAPDGSARVQQMIELIRDNFFAALGVDMVFAPGMFDHAVDTVGTINAPGSGFLNAVSVADAHCLSDSDALPARADAHARMRSSLAQADIVFAALPDIAQALRLHTPAERVIETTNAVEQAAQQIWAALEAAFNRRAPAPLPATRPALAFVSPLPPQQSGIADYSAELIAQLVEYYDIYLIVNEMLEFAPEIGAYPLRTLDWFNENAHMFERIVYHFGNSDVHQFMFPMLERYPGIVVLHDFFLSNVIDNIELNAGVENAFSKALFYSHGYSGLFDKARIGRNPTIWKYPLNKSVLDHATGVIVHSDFSVALADSWYGPGTGEHWRVLPLLRGEPESNLPGRDALRQQLGITESDFLVCSFGMMGRPKLNDYLLRAFVSFARQAGGRCHLVYVGARDESEYGTAIELEIADSGLSENIRITGFVTAEQYRKYLQAADVAVQLRGQTRGETSASVLDCLLYGAATVVNENGSNAGLSDDVLVKLPETFTEEQLTDALTRLYDDREMRHALAARGRAFVHAHHAPARVAASYVEAIEAFTQRSPSAQYRQLLRGFRHIGAPVDPRHHELINAAKAIAANQPPTQPRQLFIDISAVAQFDLKTGIQRVVRSVLLSLIASPPPGYRIEPVYGNGGNRRYQHARRFTLGMLGEADMGLDDEPIEYRPGDVFLGLDLVANCTSQNEILLTEMRNHGVKVVFVVYDILPLLLPNAFPYGTETHFREYVDTIARISDGLVCISRAVADELAEWLGAHAAPRRSPLQLGYFHLGADISASSPSMGLPADADQVFAAMALRPTLLMVGTVEPRKGHDQALAALDLLWAAGTEVNLIIVGKPGWMVDSLVKKLSNHGQLHKRLFWLSGASDEMLTRLYDTSSALLAASIGEGFGLPLIEAAQHKLPIIARKLPVFREVSKEHAFYFEGEQPEVLATAITSWLALFSAGQAPQSAEMPWLSWAQSADELVSNVLGGNWYRTLGAPSTSQQLAP